MVATTPETPPSVAGGGVPPPRPVGRFGAVVGLHRAVVHGRPALPDLDDEARVAVTGAGDSGRLHAGNGTPLYPRTPGPCHSRRPAERRFLDAQSDALE